MISASLTLWGNEVIEAQQVISSMGGSLQNSSGTLSYTLGELVIDTYTSGSVTITQGFHQPKITVTEINELSDPDFLITVFPNPTNAIITLQTEKAITGKIKYALFDLNGKVLLDGELENDKTEITFESMNPGIYFIKIFKDGIETRTFKIVKQ